jgi:hypothetical protein
MNQFPGGVIPDWYVLIRAAKYLGVAPWDLLNQPGIWTSWAITAQNAEADAEAEMMRRANTRG